MAGSEGAARRRLESIVSRVAAGVMVVAVATYGMVRTPVVPVAAPSTVVTATSPLVTDEACREAWDDPVHVTDRRMIVAPGRLDLIGESSWLDPDAEPFPDIEVEVARANDGEPVPDAEFVATTWLPRDGREYGEPVRRKGRADALGRFTIRTAQEFDLAVHSTGLGWQVTTLNRDFAEERRVLRFELAEAVVLDVRVVGPDGAPAPGAHVRCFGIEKTCEYVFHGACGNGIADWRTDLGSAGADGGLKEVECLRGRRIGFIVGNEESSWLLPPILLDDAPGARRSVELAIPPCVRVVGSVLRPDGTPGQRVKLRFERRFDAWGELESEFCPLDDGRYGHRLQHPGLYRVELSTESHLGWIARETRDIVIPVGETTLDFLDPDPAPIHADEDSDDVEEESPCASVRGSVVSMPGPEDSPAEIERGEAHLFRDGRVEEFDRLEEDGTIAWTDLPSGNYSLLVLMPGFTRFDGATFSLAPGQEIVLPEVHLEPAPRIHGRVVDAAGRPAEEVSIRLECAQPWVSSEDWIRPCHVGFATTDGSGAFELGDVGGTLRLRLDADGLPPRIIPLPAPGARDELVIEIPSTRAVTGRIEIPGGRPDVKIEIFCVVEASEALRRELQDESYHSIQIGTTEVARDGTFRLPKAPLDEFDLELWVNTSGQYSGGCTVARRRVPAGSSDLDLGSWRLASGAK